MKNRDLLLMIIAIVLFLAAASALVYILFFNNRNQSAFVASAGVQPPESHAYRSRLTGLGTDDIGEVNPRVVAVMIDNNTEAYPQHGLNEADIVYEAPVEGGTTRFMAIFSASTTVDIVGPVRSARPYYLDWAEEYGEPLYMHCGGSPEGLNEIDDRRIFDANEFSRGSYFWRDNSRMAPYNLYTSSSLWQRYMAFYGEKHPVSEWTMWKFGEFATDTEKVAGLSAAYLKNYVVSWKFNSSSTKYERYLNDEPFVNSKNEPIITDNIIAQFSSVSVIDDVGRQKVITVGDGEARIFFNGHMIRGSWEKNSLSDRTRFYGSDGQEILLTPGRTWVMILPLKTQLIVSN